MMADFLPILGAFGGDFAGGEEALEGEVDAGEAGGVFLAGFAGAVAEVVEETRDDFPRVGVGGFGGGDKGGGIGVVIRNFREAFELFFDVYAHGVPGGGGTEETAPLARAERAVIEEFLGLLEVAAGRLGKEHREAVGVVVVEGEVVVVGDNRHELLCGAGLGVGGLVRGEGNRLMATGALPSLAGPLRASFQDLLAMRAGEAKEVGGGVGHVAKTQ